MARIVAFSRTPAHRRPCDPDGADALAAALRHTHGADVSLELTSLLLSLADALARIRRQRRTAWVRPALSLATR
jgi:hypothetical protein